MSITRTNRFTPDLGLKLAFCALLAFASVSPAQVTVETVGGGVRRECGPSYGFAAGETYTVAQFNLPYSTALDSAGSLWVADYNNNDVEQVTDDATRGTSITYQIYDGSNYHPFTNVLGVAVDASDNLYVLTTSTISKFDDVTGSFPNLNPDAYLPYNTSLSGVFSGVFTPGSGATAMIVVNDANTDIYITFTNSTGGGILQIPQPYTPGHNSFNTIVSGFAFSPAGITMREDGNLALTDIRNDGIYLCATAPGSTPTLLTGGKGPGYVNGGTSFAQFNQPRGIAASGDGRMVVCDTMNNYMRVIDASNNTTTLYGTASNLWPATCCSCDPALYAGWIDGPAGNTGASASSREPYSVTITPTGNLLVTEAYYNLIRQASGSGLTPVNTTNSITGTTNLPVVTTLAASSVNGSGATLNANVDPEGSSATVYFEWGSTTNYGSNTVSVVVSTNLGGSNSVAIPLTGLTPNTVIHYQAVAINNGGTSLGGDRSFITIATPIVVTQAPSNVGQTTATLNASVDPEGSATTVYFEWGATTNYGSNTTVVNLTTNLNGTNSLAQAITGLLPNTLYHFQAVASNSDGSSLGGDVTFTTVQAPLTISPSNGYYPECITVTVTSPASNVFYTEDETSPTTNSAQVVFTSTNAEGLHVGAFQWCNSQADLSTLQMITETGGVVSSVITGFSPITNQIGFVDSPSIGSGATAFVPLVMDLKNGTSFTSAQFRVEVAPIAGSNGAPPMVPTLSLMQVTSNDYVQVVGPAPGNAPVNYSIETYTNTQAANGQGLLIFAGSGSGLNVQNFGVLGWLEIQIPYNANDGQSYSLNVLYPSGTAPIEATAPQVLTVATVPYLAGDCYPPNGYDAGEFGDGFLENNDVNTAIYASMGVRVPPFNSDAFNAMDTFPPPLGDGLIQFQDWNTILSQSVGFDMPNYVRYWTNGGNLDFYTTTNGILGGAPATTNNPPAPVPAGVSQPPPGLVWLCEASVGADTVTNQVPGSICSFPVYVKVGSGYSLDGFQFRAIVTPNSNAPPVGTVSYASANIASPAYSLYGLSSNDILEAWPLGNLETALQGSNYIGTINFEIPSTATAGQSYAVHFTGVDGAPNLSTEYSMESFPGTAWVLSSARQSASITSDEWKIAFFGNTTNSQAADGVDADGDGALNWQEYLAGTNPTNAQSVLQLAGSSSSANSLSVSWLTAPGKTYVLQSVSGLGNKGWTPIGTNTGDGYGYQYIENNNNAAAQFYRILVQP